MKNVEYFFEQLSKLHMIASNASVCHWKINGNVIVLTPRRRETERNNKFKCLYNFHDICKFHNTHKLKSIVGLLRNRTMSGQQVEWRKSKYMIGKASRENSKRRQASVETMGWMMHISKKENYWNVKLIQQSKARTLLLSPWSASNEWHEHCRCAQIMATLHPFQCAFGWMSKWNSCISTLALHCATKMKKRNYLNWGICHSKANELNAPEF